MGAGSAAQAAYGHRKYTIYTFDHKSGDDAACPWQRHETFDDMAGSLDFAKNLYDTGQYAQIEVKQSYFDKRARRIVDVTFKTFATRKKRRLGITAILLFAACCATAAFVFTGFH